MMRIFSIGIILTLLILISVVTFHTVNETSTSSDIDGGDISEWVFDQIEEYLISALEGSGVLSSNEKMLLGYGLELPDPTFEIIKDGANTTLVVNGVVRNIVSETVNVPKLRGALLDTKSEELFVWTYEADRHKALTGEVIAYTTRVENPPVGAVGFSVTFTNN